MLNTQNRQNTENTENNENPNIQNIQNIQNRPEATKKSHHKQSPSQLKGLNTRNPSQTKSSTQKIRSVPTAADVADESERAVHGDGSFDTISIPYAPDHAPDDNPNSTARQKPRKRSKAAIEKIAKDILAGYSEMPFYGNIFLPLDHELMGMLRPTLRLLDRYGLLDTEISDSPVYDIIAVLIGVGMYGIRLQAILAVAKASTDRPDNGQNDGSPSTTHQGERSGPFATLHHTNTDRTDRGNATNGAQPAHNHSTTAIDELLARDFEGRVQQGLL